MDRYGIRGELLASQDDVIVGPFLCEAGTECATVFNNDGTTTLYRKGVRPETYRSSRLEDMKPRKSSMVATMRSSLADGWYDKDPTMFFRDLRGMNEYCIGYLSDADKDFVDKTEREIRLRINSAKLV